MTFTDMRVIIVESSLTLEPSSVWCKRNKYILNYILPPCNTRVYVYITVSLIY